MAEASNAKHQRFLLLPPPSSSLRGTAGSALMQRPQRSSVGGGAPGRRHGARTRAPNAGRCRIISPKQAPMGTPCPYAAPALQAHSTIWGGLWVQQPRLALQPPSKARHLLEFRPAHLPLGRLHATLQPPPLQRSQSRARLSRAHMGAGRRTRKQRPRPIQATPPAALSKSSGQLRPRSGRVCLIRGLAYQMCGEAASPPSRAQTGWSDPCGCAGAARERPRV